MATCFRLLSVLLVLSLAGCNSKLPGDGAVETVSLGETTFQLELALSNESRRIGLGGRTSLDATKGMLFVFPDAQRRRFWMYDCLMAIDIAFVDPLGHVTAIHTMPFEPPRGETETLFDYEERLPRYPSRFPAQFVIELQPGRFQELGIKPGDRLTLDMPRMKAFAEVCDVPATLSAE